MITMVMGGARRPWEEREQKEPEAASRFHSNTQQNLNAMHCNTPTLNSTKLREAPPPKNVYIWVLPKLRFDPPYCANPGTLWHNFFAENEKILKTAILTTEMNI